MAKSKASIETEVCGPHIKGDKEEMINVTALTDTTQLNISADGTNSAIFMLTPSHGVEKDVNTNTIGTNQDTGSGQQELIRMCLQEPSNKLDAESAAQEVQTITPIRTEPEIGCAETTQDHHAVGYKREHSHSPERQSSQTSSVLVAIMCTCTCTAAGCLVEPEQQLIADGYTLPGGRQGEETQPRKRLRFDAMEGEEGGDNGRTCKCNFSVIKLAALGMGEYKESKGILLCKFGMGETGTPAPSMSTCKSLHLLYIM